ncbi:enoyl-CoA hydratase-related protein [Auritidibacter ignavus]|uniref:enoyl-CoA hydratase-related protein n=1 Tax=Auritidibacter ignavus TaxID=678932 RepID=UPI002FE508A3
MSQEVLTDIRDGVGIITLNRPERRNALNHAMLTGLAYALEAFATDDSVGAVVLTGAGGAFCSGGDVQGFAEQGGEGGGATEIDDEAAQAQLEAQRTTTGRIYSFPKPVVASLPGAFAGAGAGLALAADLRIGSEKTVFATAFANVGLGGDFGVAWLLNQLVGPAKAREYLFLSPKLRGQQCYEAGLINQIVAHEVIDESAIAIASQLASSSSPALHAIKQNLLDAPTVSLDEAMQAEVYRHKATGLTAEHQRAVEAFVTKQAPEFSTGWVMD